MNDVRLQKYLAEAGVASRRKCEQFILDGRVKVNGKIVTQLGTKVNANDIVQFDDKNISDDCRKIYIMLNKPEGYITTSKDQFGRNSVLDLIDGVNTRIYPVGRLDYNTSGLLLLTNDGDLTYKLTHPSYEVGKTYIATVEGVISEKVVVLFKKGIVLDDGYKTSPASIRMIGTENRNSIVEIIIHEGRYHQVRKMCDSVGHPVIKLKRVAIGDLKLAGLPLGSWRYLQNSELALLK